MGVERKEQIDGQLLERFCWWARKWMLGRKLGQGKVLQFCLFQDERWGLCSYLRINQLRDGATVDVVFWRKVEGIWEGGKGESIH